MNILRVNTLCSISSLEYILYCRLTIPYPRTPLDFNPPTLSTIYCTNKCGMKLNVLGTKWLIASTLKCTQRYYLLELMWHNYVALFYNIVIISERQRMILKVHYISMGNITERDCLLDVMWFSEQLKKLKIKIKTADKL